MNLVRTFSAVAVFFLSKNKSVCDQRVTIWSRFLCPPAFSVSTQFAIDLQNLFCKWFGGLYDCSFQALGTKVCASISSDIKTLFFRPRFFSCSIIGCRHGYRKRSTLSPLLTRSGLAFPSSDSLDLSCHCCSTQRVSLPKRAILKSSLWAHCAVFFWLWPVRSSPRWLLVDTFLKAWTALCGDACILPLVVVAVGLIWKCHIAVHPVLPCVYLCLGSRLNIQHSHAAGKLARHRTMEFRPRLKWSCLRTFGLLVSINVIPWLWLLNLLLQSDLWLRQTQAAQVSRPEQLVRKKSISIIVWLSSLAAIFVTVTCGSVFTLGVI